MGRVWSYLHCILNTKHVAIANRCRRDGIGIELYQKINPKSIMNISFPGMEHALYAMTLGECFFLHFQDLGHEFWELLDFRCLFYSILQILYFEYFMKILRIGGNFHDEIGIVKLSGILEQFSISQIGSGLDSASEASNTYLLLIAMRFKCDFDIFDIGLETLR